MEHILTASIIGTIATTAYKLLTRRQIMLCVTGKIPDKSIILSESYEKYKVKKYGFHNKDLYNRIQIGKTYNVTINGYAYRNLLYPNIIKVNDVSTNLMIPNMINNLCSGINANLWCQ